MFNSDIILVSSSGQPESCSNIIQASFKELVKSSLKLSMDSVSFLPPVINWFTSFIRAQCLRNCRKPSSRDMLDPFLSTAFSTVIRSSKRKMDLNRKQNIIENISNRNYNIYSDQHKKMLTKVFYLFKASLSLFFLFCSYRDNKLHFSSWSR